jgi:endonuclease-3
VLSADEIAQLIYPVGFYRTKARDILAICQQLITQHEGEVPADMTQLLALPGVGRKTADLVLAIGFGIPAICVDIHVHRICNRWGYVNTSTPKRRNKCLDKLYQAHFGLPSMVCWSRLDSKSATLPRHAVVSVHYGPYVRNEA